ncbi:PQQ-dependent sugar dehydrogenase [Paenibacillus qinlingensis]|uniref:Glucose/arabinose dehydrogenase n=1 Tax=Paenibacillus qinlingensis TaxID=1837343 RepID=A0ABU1NMZ3_9BACL|nr:PQQ-dependent sugar dehydrogenase [Paenibacillus qinlingensis]MDR6548836.1 glucose/arabinose dehydrogenase [Paenibacillus qinlingensis]
MKRYVLASMSLFLLLLLTACFGSKNTEPSSTTSNGISLTNMFEPTIFDHPVGIEHRVGKPELLYIVEQPGRILSVNINKPKEKPSLVLDITARVNDSGNEQGLLGLAFHPKHPTQAYVNYTTETHTIIARYDADLANPALLDPKSEKVLLTFKQPYPNHNGGQLAFGPDGYLYIATGDGGSSGDPQNNSQNLQSLLGKILRIDVDKQANGLLYAIPADNPFINKGAKEIYAYGLRNPWRFSFDSVTGKLWAADVGQNRFEEINIVEKGKNYGWRIQEGFECYEPKTGCNKTGLEQPLFTYGRDQGVSVTGGYVYRGIKVPELKGWYVYADYGTGNIWAMMLASDGKVTNKTLLASGLHIASFGTDAAGELYLCTQDGKIMKIV